jgi:hypothetical protein
VTLIPRQIEGKIDTNPSIAFIYELLPKSPFPESKQQLGGNKILGLKIKYSILNSMFWSFI